MKEKVSTDMWQHAVQMVAAVRAHRPGLGRVLDRGRSHNLRVLFEMPRTPHEVCDDDSDQ